LFGTKLTAEIALLRLMILNHKYPIKGNFSTDQRAIFEGVLSAQRAVLDMMRPGVLWSDCHRAAECKILEALLEIGVVIIPDGETFADLVSNNIGAIFFPHGLGHFIGCDTHDVGGYVDN
jgi:Xaa-Pro dipeptidase